MKTFLNLCCLLLATASDDDLPPVDILIPMAGLGSRFTKHPSYANAPPKPLIRLPDDRPLIELAISDLIPKRYAPRYIFVVRKSQREEHDLANVLSTALLRNGVSPSSMIIIDAADGVTAAGEDITTDGPAVTALRATGAIMNGVSPPTTPLLIANCDQHIVWGEDGETVDDLIDCVKHPKTIGCLATYHSEPDASKSYVKIDEATGYAVDVAEKRVISNDASTGLYLFQTGIAFINAARAMIEEGEAGGKKVNGEWYERAMRAIGGDGPLSEAREQS